jgi:hypothetical protein
MMTDYFLRTTDKNGKAHGGFQWPMQVGAIVEAPDWDAKPMRGHGLHGLKDGLGNASHLFSASDAVWWIVKADDAVDLGGKHKFPRCEVVALGDRATVTAALYALRPGPIHYLTLTGGYGATLTGGYGAMLTGGDDATLTGGDDATLTGGDDATLTGGNGATLTGGNGATLIFLRWINGRRRVLTAYVGEGGIEAGKAHRANDDFSAVVVA